MRLFEHLALEYTGGPLLVIATVRDEPREGRNLVDRSLALVRTQPHARTIELEGLSRREVAEMLGEAVGGQAPVDLTSELFARTEGVPFYLGEAIRMLRDRGDLDRPDQIPRTGVTLPAEATDLIRRRLDGLSSACASLLSAAAVIGRSFTVASASALSSVSSSS